jgi:hypothetical protein
MLIDVLHRVGVRVKGSHIEEQQHALAAMAARPFDEGGDLGLALQRLCSKRVQLMMAGYSVFYPSSPSAFHFSLPCADFRWSTTSAPQPHTSF